MYKDYFHLSEEPFNITPDPRFLYMTARHREALDHLLYGVRQRKGFICLTGEIGAGKTTLCRVLLAQLGQEAHTALILNPVLTATQLLRAIVDELGIPTKRRDRLGYLTLLNHFLLQSSAEGKLAVLIIDEAQGMPLATLEMARLLSNLETERHKLLQIVLVGQPELRTLLDKPSMRQLAQRITVRFHLGTMTSDETAEYIRHRLRIAGGAQGAEGPDRVDFDADAVGEIYRYSRGTPRLVNALGDKALLAGYVYGTTRIDQNLVRLAIQDLREAS